VNADPWRDLDDWARRSAKPSKQEYRDAWEDFGRQPGTRLRWVRTDALRNELRTAGQTVVTVRWGWKPRAVTASGRVFTRRWVPGSWRDITQATGGYPPGMRVSGRDIYLRQFFDESGEPVLYTGGGPVDRYIKFPGGQRWLLFPVLGTGPANAIMTAVDQDGSKIARYRLVKKAAEVTVHPGQQLADELALAIAASAPWLRQRFGA